MFFDRQQSAKGSHLDFNLFKEHKLEVRNVDELIGYPPKNAQKSVYF